MALCVIGSVWSVAFPICTGMARALPPAEDEVRPHPATNKAAPSTPDTTAPARRAIFAGGLESLVVCMVENSASGAGPAREEIALDDRRVVSQRIAPFRQDVREVFVADGRRAGHFGKRRVAGYIGFLAG
jgi:hypothetical protein